MFNYLRVDEVQEGSCKHGVKTRHQAHSAKLGVKGNHLQVWFSEDVSLCHEQILLVVNCYQVSVPDI